MLLHLRRAGILPHEVLADAGGTAAEFSEPWHLASGIGISQICSFGPITTTRCHAGSLPGGIIMFWRLGGQFGGGWGMVGANPGYPPK